MTGGDDNIAASEVNALCDVTGGRSCGEAGSEGVLVFGHNLTVLRGHWILNGCESDLFAR